MSCFTLKELVLAYISTHACRYIDIPEELCEQIFSMKIKRVHGELKCNVHLFTPSYSKSYLNHKGCRLTCGIPYKYYNPFYSKARWHYAVKYTIDDVLKDESKRSFVWWRVTA